MPACLHGVAAAAPMIMDTKKIVLHHSLILHTSHQVTTVLNNIQTQYMMAQRLSGYEAVLVQAKISPLKLHQHLIHQQVYYSNLYSLKTLIWFKLVMIVWLSFMKPQVYVLTFHLFHSNTTYMCLLMVPAPSWMITPFFFFFADIQCVPPLVWYGKHIYYPIRQHRELSCSNMRMHPLHQLSYNCLHWFYICFICGTQFSAMLMEILLWCPIYYKP